MKKFRVKRLVALGLTLAMTVGLCACGGGDGDEGSGNKGGGKNNPNSALAKENVYRLQEISLPELYEPGNGNLNVMGTSHINGKLYVIAQIYNWNSNGDQTDYRIISMNEDGSDVQILKLQQPGIAESEDGGLEDGDDEVGTFEEDTTEDGVTDDVEMYEEPMNNTWEYTSYGDLMIAADGTVYGIKRHQFEDYSDPENYVSESHTYVCAWDTEGNYVSEVEIEGIGSNEEEWIYVNNLLMGSDGNLYLLLRGDNTYKVKVNQDGSVSPREKMPDEVNTLFYNYERIIPGENGTITVVYHDENDWAKTYYATYDIVTNEMGEVMDFPSSILYSWDYNVMTSGLNSNIIYTSGNGIWSYRQGEEAGKMMLDFINSDLYIQNFFGVVQISEETFLGIYSEDWDSGVKAGIFTHVKPEDIKDKTVLVLAGNWVYSDIKKRVIEYNRNNSDYRIVLKEYSNYNSYEDYNAGITKLNNDITTGGMPDILIASGLPVENYISKGLIADIDKLIQNDEELSQVEFMENAFDAYRVNGKLYYIVPDFEVYSMMAKASLVGERDSWTMEDMKQVLAGMGEGAKAFGDTTRNSFMDMVMRYCGNEFVDVSTGKCSFNTDNFISMMEFAKTLPTDMNYGDESYWDDYWQNYGSQYRENRTLLMQINFYRFPEISNSINGYFGEDVSFVGFPTESGNGSYIMASNTYALSAKSKNLDEAWNFMRYYLQEDYQKNKVSYFPVRKDLFFEKAQEATERPYWENEDGQKEYYDNTFYIGGEEIKIDPLTQEQLKQVTDFIQSVHNPYYYNEEIMNIINEEIEAFFSGQKPAKDVAGIIQSRAQIYVDTNR